MSVALRWDVVRDWADLYKVDREEALDLMFALRDERENLENKFIAEKSK